MSQSGVSVRERRKESMCGENRNKSKPTPQQPPPHQPPPYIHPGWTNGLEPPMSPTSCHQAHPHTAPDTAIESPPPPWPPLANPVVTPTTLRHPPWLNDCTSSLPTSPSHTTLYHHDRWPLHPHPLLWPNYISPPRHMACSLISSLPHTHLPPEPIAFPGAWRWMDLETAQDQLQIILDIDFHTYFQASLIHYLIFRYCLLLYPPYHHYSTLLSIYLITILQFSSFEFISDFICHFWIFNSLSFFFISFAPEHSPGPTQGLSIDTHRWASLRGGLMWQCQDSIGLGWIPCTYTA